MNAKELIVEAGLSKDDVKRDCDPEDLKRLISLRVVKHD